MAGGTRAGNAGLCRMPPAAVIRSLLVFDEKHPLYLPYRMAKRIAIGIVGGSVLIVGICMVVLPGPAFVVIPVGLGILGLEFAWHAAGSRKPNARPEMSRVTSIPRMAATRTATTRSQSS
jgi:hypothetical protein